MKGALVVGREASGMRVSCGLIKSGFACVCVWLLFVLLISHQGNQCRTRSERTMRRDDSGCVVACVLVCSGTSFRFSLSLLILLKGSA